MDYSQLSQAQGKDENGLVFDQVSLYEYFMRLPDVRGAHSKRYRFLRDEGGNQAEYEPGNGAGQELFILMVERII